MFLRWNHSSIRLTGRWDRRNAEAAITTSIGSIIEISYYGEMALLYFDLKDNVHPYPHIWVQVDKYSRVEVTAEPFIRIQSFKNPNTLHYLKIVFKSSVEIQNRWYEPLQAKLSFKGIEVERPGVLPADFRKLIEFIGDSITEGVFVDSDVGEESQSTRVFQDDVCGTFAWLTAEKLNYRSRYFGFGALGVSVGGHGGVPKAAQSYPYVYEGCPMDEQQPDCIIINQGTNDSSRKVPSQIFINEYCELLKVVRSINKKSLIICLSIFIGDYVNELQKLINDFNETYNDNVIFINTQGWTPKEPIHPMRDGTKIISEKLFEKLAALNITGEFNMNQGNTDYTKL